MATATCNPSFRTNTNARVHVYEFLTTAPRAIARSDHLHAPPVAPTAAQRALSKQHASRQSSICTWRSCCNVNRCKRPGRDHNGTRQPNSSENSARATGRRALVVGSRAHHWRLPTPRNWMRYDESPHWAHVLVNQHICTFHAADRNTAWMPSGAVAANQVRT